MAQPLVSPPTKLRWSSMDNLQLSVVADDVQLDTERDFLESVNRLASSARPTPSSTRCTPQPNTRRTGTSKSTRVNGGPTKVSLDDPDDIFCQTRQSELHLKRNWIYPSLNALALVLRLAAPMTNMANKHVQYKPFLAPTEGLFWMQLPLILLELVFVFAGFTRILRGLPILNGITPGFVASVACGVGWQWLYGSTNGVNSASSFAVIWTFVSLLTLVAVKSKRRKGLVGVWHHHKRQGIKARDFWLVELPLVAEAIWAFTCLVITCNYLSVSEWINHYPDDAHSSRLAQRMLSSAVTTLTLTAAITVLAYNRKKGGHTIVAVAAAWFYFDNARSFGREPDVVKSPHLVWADPYILGAAFQSGCATLGCLSLLLALVSLCMHLSRLLAMLHGIALDSSDQRSVFSFLGGRSFPNYPSSTQSDWEMRDKELLTVKRRPSEFLMRHASSSLTDAMTPQRKK